MVTKENYSIRVSNKDQLKRVPCETVRSVLEMLSNTYEKGEHSSELFIFEVEKECVLSKIEAHQKAIKQLEEYLSEIEENIKEHKEIYLNEQKELENIWFLLSTAHFKQQRIKTPEDIYILISKGSLMPNKDILLYCIDQNRKEKDNVPPNDKLSMKKRRACDWLEQKLEYLLTTVDSYDF